MIVLDASVFAKLFLDEPDRSQAQTLIAYTVENRHELVAPHLLLYEALSIGVRHGVPFAKILRLLESVSKGGLSLIEPTVTELVLAEKITTTGNKAAGYPALQDSIYQAVAIKRGGLFVTADHRHFAKAKLFGNVVLLGDWRP